LLIMFSLSRFLLFEIDVFPIQFSKIECFLSTGCSLERPWLLYHFFNPYVKHFFYFF